MTKLKIVILVPAYNEEKTLGGVIDDLKNHGYQNIVVIDDGSSDGTSKICQSKKVMWTRHMINRGLGGVLGTGFQVARELQADIVVTCDADGQHDSRAIKSLLQPLSERKADFVIGSRMISAKGMPFWRRIFNHIGNLITLLLFGKYVSDSQSGMRALNSKALSKITIRTNRMEVSSELIQEIKKHNLRLQEVPINAIYTEYSLSKGQNFLVGVKTFLRLLVHKIIS